jgi:hypothetical protein
MFTEYYDAGKNPTTRVGIMDSIGQTAYYKGNAVMKTSPFDLSIDVRNNVLTNIISDGFKNLL